MVKLEVINKFTLARFDELKNIERFSEDKKGTLFVGDKFICEKELADYLLGDNKFGKPFVKLIEVIPVKEEKVSTKKEKKSTKK